MKPIWLLDTGPARRRPYPASDYGVAAAKAGHEVVRVDFDEVRKVPDHRGPADRPVFAHGSIGFVDAAAASGAKPGGFEDKHAFLPETWLGRLGAHCLAEAWTVIDYGTFKRDRVRLQEEFGNNGHLFLKPANGGKAFNGLVLAPGDLLDDRHWSRFRRWAPLEDAVPILIVRPSEIASEWRFVIVDGRAVAVSSYRLDGETAFEPIAPEGAWDAANAVASGGWNPARAYVADVALSGSRFRLIELNCFGTSGTYAIDADAVVEALAA